MQNILLQPQTHDEARLVKQFAKLMKIKAVAVKETPKQRKNGKFSTISNEVFMMPMIIFPGENDSKQRRKC